MWLFPFYEVEMWVLNMKENLQNPTCCLFLQVTWCFFLKHVFCVKRRRVIKYQSSKVWVSRLQLKLKNTVNALSYAILFCVLPIHIYLCSKSNILNWELNLRKRGISIWQESFILEEPDKTISLNIGPCWDNTLLYDSPSHSFVSRQFQIQYTEIAREIVCLHSQPYIVSHSFDSSLAGWGRVVRES